jgi:hypothetical protein
MKESVIVQANIEAKIKLENQYNFNVKMSIGIAAGGDSYLLMNFPDLTIDELKVLAELSKHPRGLPIRAELMDREQYNLTYLSKFSSKSNLSMTWDWLSDEPLAYMMPID